MARKNAPENQIRMLAVSPTPPARRKAAGTRTWLVISNNGPSRLEEVGKQSIMRRTGLPTRDLRILDPMLSYPSTILGRERAIVVKLEHIKAIITAAEVLVLNPKDPAVQAFVQDLQSRVSNSGCTAPQVIDINDIDMKNRKKSYWDSPSVSPNHGYGSLSSFDVCQNHQGTIESLEMPPGMTGERCSPLTLQKDDDTKILPFEFRVLEVCLESACRCLESETSTLEEEAYPALDELTSKISTLNLERVRQIKSRLVAISGRVQKVRDELEHLLDDDMDMLEMHLTDKLSNEPFDETSPKVDVFDDASDLDGERCEYVDYKFKTKSLSESLNDFKPNIQELEMLLEAYFVQIEGTLNKLSTMREYVDGTEDYINIMLDDKQNQLLQMGIMLSTATLIISAGIAVVGLFGMNIHISLFDASSLQFWETTAGTIVGCVLLYIIALVFGKKKGLLA